jgi:GAF domain-containing protein
VRSFLGTTIASSERTYGWLSFAGKLDAAEFSDQDEAIARTLAAQAAVAYENAGLYEELYRRAINLEREVAERGKAEVELRKRTDQQAAIAALGQQALAGGELSTLMNVAVAHVVGPLKVEYCQILELQPSQTELVMRAGVGWKPGLVGRATVQAGAETLEGFTLISGEPVIVEDVQSEPRFPGSFLLRGHHVRSSLSMVIPGASGAVGVLSVHSRQTRSFDQKDVDLLSAVASVLATAIERLRPSGTARRRRSAQRRVPGDARPRAAQSPGADFERPRGDPPGRRGRGLRGTSPRDRRTPGAPHGPPDR